VFLVIDEDDYNVTVMYMAIDLGFFYEVSLCLLFSRRPLLAFMYEAMSQVSSLSRLQVKGEL
jgi:hypothetical protein